MRKRQKLGWCPECKESSTVVKFYGEEKKSRLEVCLNKGCNFLRHLPRLACFLLFLPNLCLANPTSTPTPMYLKASWYSMESLIKEGTYAYSKGVMANGKKFDETAFTCATRDYPLKAVLRVTNTKTGKAIQVEVTDRINKRFAGKRIDLSKRAFAQIADLKQGLVSVRVERVK